MSRLTLSAGPLYWRFQSNMTTLETWHARPGTLEEICSELHCSVSIEEVDEGKTKNLQNACRLPARKQSRIDRRILATKIFGEVLPRSALTPENLQTRLDTFLRTPQLRTEHVAGRQESLSRTRLRPAFPPGKSPKSAGNLRVFILTDCRDLVVLSGSSNFSPGAEKC